MSLPLTSMAWGMIQITLLCGGALTLAWLLGGRRPQVTTAVLSGCCLAVLMLAAIAWLPQSHWSLVTAPDVIFAKEVDTPKPTVDLRELKQESRSVIESTTAIASASLQAYDNRARSSSGSRAADWIVAHVRGFDESLKSVERSRSVRVSRLSARGMTFFLAGLALMTGLWLYGWQYMRLIIRRSKPLNDEFVERLVAEYAAQLGLRRLPQLRVSSQVPIGATVGCFRQMLILHTDWSQWNRNELQAVIVHELAHVARWDFLWVVISSWVRILFFFHPLMHFVVRRMRLEQELAADQLAAGMMNSASAYGRALASLTLRSQKSMRASSPMLSADQICIVRRITMLKHGCLVPRVHLWRWASCLTLATTLLIVPLSGLRGTPPELRTDDNSSTAVKNERDANSRVPTEDPEVKAKQFADEKIREEVNAKFPPLKLTGSMLWNPGRLQSTEFLPGIRWLHYLYTVAGLGSFPENGQLHGEAELQIGWSDLAREHGSLNFGGQVKQADLVAPSSMTQFVTSPILGPIVLTDKKKQIEGRTATALTRRYATVGDESGSQKEEVLAIDSWVVDDEHGFIHGTEQEVAEIIRGDVNLFDSIAQPFLNDYKESAFAVAFKECDGWDTKFRDFNTGSKYEVQWAIAAPLFKGLNQLGLFVQGRKVGGCRVRAVYADNATAAQAKLALVGIRALVIGFLDQASEETPAQSEEDAVIVKSLQSMRIEQMATELQVTFDLPSTFISPMNLSRVPSWVTLDNPVTLVDNVPGAVRMKGEAFGCLGAFLAQSVKAKSYHGKRVRLVAELACHHEATDRAGLLLWTSGEQERSLTFQSQSIDGRSNIESLMNRMTLQDHLHDENGTWKAVSIEVNVPSNSQVLTIGCYAKDASLRIRNIRLEIVGDEFPSKVVNKPWLPSNLFVIPGAVLYDAPSNMDFHDVEATSLRETSQVAEGKAENDAVRR